MLSLLLRGCLPICEFYDSYASSRARWGGDKSSDVGSSRDEQQLELTFPCSNCSPTLILPPLLMTALAARKAFTGPRGKFLENLTHVTASTFPLLFLPPNPLFLPRFSSPKLTHSLRSISFSFFVVGLSLYLFLPPSIAVFPQRASVPIGKLEKDVFGKFVDPRVGGEKEKVFFNKGL